MLEPAPALLLVALCVAAGAYCTLRMRGSSGRRRRTAAAEALMGFGMAAMAVPAVAPVLGVLPGWSWRICAVVFGLSAVSSAWAAWRDPHHRHHVVAALSMVYMATAMAQHRGAAGHVHGGTDMPVLTGVLLVYFTAHALHTGARLVPVHAPGARTAAGVDTGAGAAWAERPELVRACRVAMSIAMLAMLLGV